MRPITERVRSHRVGNDALWRAGCRRREDVVEGGAEGHVDLRHRGGHAEPRERGDAMPRNRLIDAAWHDAAKMVEIGIDVERDAVIGDPVAHPDADGGDLVLAAIGAAGANHPHADAAVASLAPDIEPRQRDRKSTRLNSSHMSISYAVFCLKK